MKNIREVQDALNHGSQFFSNYYTRHDTYQYICLPLQSIYIHHYKNILSFLLDSLHSRISCIYSLQNVDRPVRFYIIYIVCRYGCAGIKVMIVEQLDLLRVGWGCIKIMSSFLSKNKQSLLKESNLVIWRTFLSSKVVNYRSTQSSSIFFSLN